MDGPQGFIVDRRWDDEKKRWIRGPHHMRLSPIFRRIFDEALAMDDGIFRYRTIIISLPKKTGKTAYAASVVEWYAWTQGEGNEIYVIANDEAQVKDRVFKDLCYSLKRSPWLPADILEGKGEARLKGNDARVIALGQHYQSAAGSRHGLTCWDELWTYTTENHHRMWDELTPVPTENNSIRIIVTYAGFTPGTSGRAGRERNLLWDLYSENVGMRPDGEMEYAQGNGKQIPGMEDLPVWSNGRVFCCWFHDPLQPWQTPEYYAEERKELRAGAYLRLHKNTWSSTREDFIDMEWWKRAEKLSGPLPKNDRKKLIALGIDFAPKHDAAAGVGTYMDYATGKVKQAIHKIWHGSPEAPLHPAIIGNWIIEMFTYYRIVNVRYDPYQFLGTAMTLQDLGLPMEEWTSGDPNYIPMTEELYRLLKYDNFETYPDEECREHIAGAIIESKPAGDRISKDKTGKNDYAVALAMSAHYTVTNAQQPSDEIQYMESPFSDMRSFPGTVEEAELERLLPRELRSFVD